MCTCSVSIRLSITSVVAKKVYESIMFFGSEGINISLVFFVVQCEQLNCVQSIYSLFGWRSLLWKVCLGGNM